MNLAVAKPAEPLPEDEDDEDDGPLDYSYRQKPPKERAGQLTRKGASNTTLDDPRFAALQWFILRTAPREEMRATLVLERKDHAVLYPREQVFRRKNRYAKTKVGVLRPLTRGYLFTGFAHTPNWLDVLSCQSLLGVVSVNGRPREMPFHQAAGFIKGHAFRVAPEYHKHMISNREFDVGDVVEVLGTMLHGTFVKVTAINGKFAEALLAFTDDAQRPMQIPLDNLVALP